MVWGWDGNGLIEAVPETAEAGYTVVTIPLPSNDGVSVPALFFIDAEQFATSGGTVGGRSRRASDEVFPFVIDMATGKVTVAAGATLDYESAPWVNFTVTITEAANSGDSGKPRFSVNALVPVPIGPVGCVAGSTWSETGTSPCEDARECDLLLNETEAAPPTASTDRVCTLSADKSSADIADKDAAASSSVGAIVAALILALVMVVVVVGALIRRKRESEERCSKDEIGLESSINPALLRSAAALMPTTSLPDYSEAGAGMERGNPLDDHEYAYSSGLGGAKAAALAGGSEEATYDVAASTTTGAWPDDTEAMYDVASNIKPLPASGVNPVTYDTGCVGEDAIYDNANRSGVGGSVGTEEDVYGLALAGLLDDTDDNVYCAAAAFYAQDKADEEETVYDHAENTHGCDDEPVYAFGTADTSEEPEEPLYAFGAATSDTDTTRGKGNAEAIYAFGTADDDDGDDGVARGEPVYALGSNVASSATEVQEVPSGPETTYDIGTAPDEDDESESSQSLYAVGNNNSNNNNMPVFEDGAKALLEGLDQANSRHSQAIYALGGSVEVEEEDDVAVASDAGYMGCGTDNTTPPLPIAEDVGYVGCGSESSSEGGGSRGNTLGAGAGAGASSKHRLGSVVSAGSNGSYFEDNAFIASGDGCSIRLASVQRANPMYRQSMFVDAVLDTIGDASANNAEENA